MAERTPIHEPPTSRRLAIDTNTSQGHTATEVPNDGEVYSPLVPLTTWDKLSPMLSSKASMVELVQFEGDVAQVAVDILSDQHPRDDLIKLRIFWAIGALCKKNLILPSSTIILECPTDISVFPLSRSGPSDVYTARLGEMYVTLRRPRIYAGDIHRTTLMKEIYKEVSIWKHLQHPNLLEFIGVSFKAFHEDITLVTPLLGLGNVVEYINVYPKHSRVQLMSDIASGLEYLHSLNVLHGDLRSANVLIDENKCGVLANYGLSGISLDETTCIAGAGSTPWMAPERFDGAPVSKPVDVYAFAIVAWELFSGAVPFADLRVPIAVIRGVMDGARPPEPTGARDIGMTAVLWELIQRCWKGVPSDRPIMRQVVDILALE